jgi:hypothetical protein
MARGAFPVDKIREGWNHTLPMTSNSLRLLAFIGIGLIAGVFFLAAVLLRGQSKEEERTSRGLPPGPWREKSPQEKPAPPEPEKKLSPVKAAPSGPIDLIGLIDIQKDAVAGNWTMDGSTLVTSEVPFGRLQLPCVPPEEYELSFMAARQTGTDSLNVGLAVGGRQFVVILDGMKDGDTAGVDIINFKGFMENETTFKGKLLPKGTACEISCSVHKDKLTVKVNGRAVIEWAADYTKVSKYRGWNVPDGRALFIGSYEASFRIEKFVLTPVSGTASLLR